MDITDVGPFTRVECPVCSEEVRVKTEMGAYVLRRRLAMGGMSVLFVAHDKTLGREVAVKVLNEDYSNVDVRVAQFEQEAKLTAAVSHPNVVKVYTVGRAYGRCYIAMELVSGRSLEAIMDERGALPEAEVMPIAMQVVDGLRAAHGAGLLHRDIKPGNILIDEAGTAKIVDFGLSLLTESGSVQAEEVWATPYYVPPETVLNQEEDFRSDVYALGASLYHALSGAPPVSGRDTSTEALKAEKKNVMPLGKRVSWLHSATAEMVDRAMAYAPNKRFESYEEFRGELERINNSVSNDAEETPIHGAVRAERRRKEGKTRHALLFSGVLVLLVAGGGAFFLLNRDKKNEVASEENGPENGASSEQLLAGSPSLSAEDGRRIGEFYANAREALASRDYVASEEWYEKVALDSAALPATAAWARFEAVVAAYLNGRPGKAREHLAVLQESLETREMAETALARRLSAASEVLDSLEFVSDERVPKTLEDPVRATIFFVMSLKMWEQGQLERARDYMTQFTEEGPWEGAEWMHAYQAAAQVYLNDYENLREVSSEVDLTDVDAMQVRYDELSELYVLLRTKGRARFNVRAQQADLKRTIKLINKAGSAPGWEKVRGEVFSLWREKQLASVRGALEGYQAHYGESALRKSAMLALLDSAEVLMMDLVGTTREIVPDVPLRDSAGMEYGRIIQGQEGGLLVEHKEEKLTVPVGQFEFSSLLALYLQVLHSVDDQAVRARGLNAATSFAILSGLHEQGELLYARVRGEPAPGGFGTWEDFRALLEAN